MQILTDDLLLISVLVQNAIVEIVYLVDLIHDVFLELLIGYAICCTHCEGICHEPVVYDSLGDCHELVGGVWADIQPDGVHETSCA